MYDAIFLTTPSRLFSDVTEAHRCARALYDYIHRFCDKNGIGQTNVEIGVSNVNPRKAQYVNIANGVGRPKKILTGNLNKCFVKPHLHILLTGNHKAFISNLIINYFTKKYVSPKNKNKKVRIWKRYVLMTDTERVRKYIKIQSLHYLTLESKKSDKRTELNKEIKNKVIKINVKNHINTTQTPAQQNNYNQNYVLLCNLRSKWLVLEQLKKIADYIVNYDLYDALVVLQDRIKNYGNMINANIDVAHLYNNDIINITIEIEKLRQIIVTEKQKYDYFVGQA